MNDDVVAQILLRLPAKSVFRCRAVCRSWRRITTAAYFVAAHSRRRPLQLLGYTGPNDESLRDDEFLVTSAPVTAVPAVYDGDDTECRRFLRRNVRLCLRGSCDGLLLFERVNAESMLICNPATRQLVNLPPPQRRTCSFFAVTVGKTVGESVYWGRREVDDRSRIMAFDTVSERFRAVAPPPVEHADEGPLLDMDGTFAVAAMSAEPYLDVWASDGCGGERWGLVYDTKEKRMLSCSHRSRSNPWNAAYRESLITVKPRTPPLPPNSEPWLNFY
uniref:F-box domain-containing protein n=1 Tax=Oryza meridionalis TaxID=40149 RepID=A0A0E0CF04_9ORYZ